MMRSLLAPLVIGLVLSLALMFGVQWSVVRIAIEEVMEDYVAEELAQDAAELSSGLTVLPDSQGKLGVAHFDPVYISPASGRYFQILDEGSIAIRSPSLAGASLNVTPLGRGQRRVSPVVGPLKQALLLSTTGYHFQGRNITVAVAADMQRINAEFDRVTARYAKVSLIMFAFLVALQVSIVRLALGPLRRVQADVGRLEHGEIGQLGERVPAEVLPLVREVNRLLELLTRRLQRSRESLGNLAHALKTPLTLLTQMAQDDHLQRHPLLGRQIAEQVGILSQRIDSELRRARVAGAGAPGTPLDLALELQALCATMRQLHRERQLEIDCRVDAGMHFHGDREDFLELGGILLDNACKWAKSRVLVTVRDDKGMVLVVADDGPGCSPEGLQQIAHRGVRLDEATDGHGLGLAIATGIAASYGAEIRFGGSADLGGFEARVSFGAV